MSIPIQLYAFSELQPYEGIYQHMREFTRTRTETTADTIWFLEHFPVFTQGQAGRAEHILDAGHIPIVQSDRGGQVTYHGPGQLMVYTLCDLRRLPFGLKEFVQHLQNTVIALLAQYQIKAHSRAEAPGVYVDDAKICSLGLRVRHGCTYHGVSLNVNMDLAPFQRINPCGFRQMRMIQISDFVPTVTVEEVQAAILPLLCERLYNFSSIPQPIYFQSAPAEMFHYE